MGIKGLFGLIQQYAPGAIRVKGITQYRGLPVAIDTNIFLYSFMAAIRKDNNELVDSEGNPTSHIKGIFHRTLTILEAGVTPVYVLEGESPVRKSSELQKRKDRKKKIQDKIALAQEFGDEEGVQKYAKQLVNVTKIIIDEAAYLLKLLGVPVIQAPGESESQCAEFCKKGQAWGLVTKDMDALALASPVMLRNLHTKMEYTAMKTRVDEIQLWDVLNTFGMSIEQFIDLCILLGCDYSGTIKGIGPQTAFELIKQHQNIEGIIDNIQRSGNQVVASKDGFNYQEARMLFVNPNVIPAEYFSIEHFQCFTPDYDTAREFLIGKSFNHEKVDKMLRRCQLAHNKILAMYSRFQFTYS